jgi:haloalkane dehalogenase
MIEFLRTPDERFAGLPDFPFAPNYETLPRHGLRMHYVD